MPKMEFNKAIVQIYQHIYLFAVFDACLACFCKVYFLNHNSLSLALLIVFLVGSRPQNVCHYFVDLNLDKANMISFSKAMLTI